MLLSGEAQVFEPLTCDVVADIDVLDLSAPDGPIENKVHIRISNLKLATNYYTSKLCYILKLCSSRFTISKLDMGNCHDNSYGNCVLIISCTIVCTYAPAICYPLDLISIF